MGWGLDLGVRWIHEKAATPSTSGRPASVSMGANMPRCFSLEDGRGRGEHGRARPEVYNVTWAGSQGLQSALGARQEER